MFGIDDLASGDVLKAGANLFGSVLGFAGQQDTNANSAAIAAQTNQFNAEQAGLNRTFQSDQAQIARDYATQMSNSAYQRQVADMEAAGLNPMLAYMKGGGASTPTISPPSGSSASGVMANYRSPASAAIEAGFTSAQTAKTQAEVPKIEAETELTRSQQDLVEQTIEKVGKETRNLDDEQQRLKYVIQNLADSSALMAQQGQTEVEKRKVLTATFNKLDAEGFITRAEAKAMKDTNFVGVYARELKVVPDMIGDWVDRILRRAASTSEEHTNIVRDSEGREVGRSSYRKSK